MHFYFAQFYPEATGGYSVLFPDFPGCQTQGDNLNEAMTMAMEALTLRIESDIEDGIELPAPSNYEQAKAKAIAYNREIEVPVKKGALYLLTPADVKLEPFTRLNISMHPRLLARVDRVAKDLGMTRSGFLSQAAQEHIQTMNQKV